MKPPQVTMTETMPPALDSFPEKYPLKTIAFINNRDWSTPQVESDYVHGDVECDKDDNCQGGKRRFVMIPEANSYLVDWKAALDTMPGSPIRGYFVAELTNEGRKSTKWHLGVGEKLYAWVGPLDGSGKNRSLAFYKINEGHSTVTRVLTSARVADCKDLDTTRPKHRNVHLFPTVGGHCAAAANVLVEKPHGEFSILIPSGSGFWVSCASGCCEGTYIN